MLGVFPPNARSRFRLRVVSYILGLSFVIKLYDDLALCQTMCQSIT